MSDTVTVEAPALSLIERAKVAYIKKQALDAEHEQERLREAGVRLVNEILRVFGSDALALPEVDAEGNVSATVEGLRFKFIGGYARPALGLVLPCAKCGKPAEWGPVGALEEVGQALAEADTVECYNSHPSDEPAPTPEAKLGNAIMEYVRGKLGGYDY